LFGLYFLKTKIVATLFNNKNYCKKLIMKRFTFKSLLQSSGWNDNVTVVVDENGRISELLENTDDKGEIIQGYAIPGFQNAHSHAFQYAMAGRAEQHQNPDDADDFWGWRETMYQLALSITPDDLYSIAKDLYSEMLRNGYTQVAEFHYVHHQTDGTPYANLAEMGEALLKASRDTGIKITLIPIFYQKGGFGKAPNDRQRRFISENVEDYRKLLDATIKVAEKYPLANVAIGIHSMRGVDPQDILKVAKEFPQDLPFHIHIAEQLKEIEDSIAFLGKRPVEWMLENVAIKDRFHLVHATHLTDKETEGIAKSGANVVLCPSTEGNLGDGIFPLINFQKLGGKWSIGTDSHIGLNPMEELRILDYGQRLISHKRNIMIGNGFNDSGRYAIHQATLAGRKAMNNFEETYFKVGADFDACVIAAEHPTLAGEDKSNLASRIVYSSDSSMMKYVFVRGRRIG
jgi:formiminoglutamate deiminase